MDKNKYFMRCGFAGGDNNFAFRGPGAKKMGDATEVTPPTEEKD
jgi:hypothetical protein